MARKPTQRRRVATFDFDRLESLRLLCKEIQHEQAASLAHFRSGVGYQHVRRITEPKVSVSSSATCVLSMVATGLWNDNHTPGETKDLLETLIPKKDSAGLKEDNVFTTAWILEAVSL